MKKIKLFDPMSDNYISSMDSTSMVEDYSRVKNNGGVELDPFGKFRPITGGLYDPATFGREFFSPKYPNAGGVKKCTCGQTRELGRCPVCHDLLLDHKNYLAKGGYYTFCVPFIGLLKDEAFLDIISDIVDFTEINRVAITYKLSLLEAIWCCEFIPVDIDSPGKNLNEVKYRGKYRKIITKEADENSEFTKCGLCGISAILKSYTPIKGSSFTEALKYINQNLYILPVSDRPVGRGYDGYPTYPPLTQAYSMLIALNELAKGVIWGDGGPEGKLVDKLALASNITKAIMLMSKNNLALVKSSKQSLLRYYGTGRVSSSFRANIISARVPMDTVLLPRALAYEAVKGELLNRLQILTQGTGNDPLDLYYDPNDEVIKLFEDLIEESIVLIGRQPTLHKFGQLAFKCRLWNKSDFDYPVEVDKISAVGMNVVVCSPFNADFDGDQMYGIIFTDLQDREKVWRRAGVPFNWIYQKNNESVFVPSKEILAGLHVGTKLEFSNAPIPDYHKFKAFSTVETLYNNDQIMFNTPIECDGEITTYGIMKVNKILDKDLKFILHVDTNDQIDINSSTFKYISAYISTRPNRVEIITNLMNCGDDWIKRYGSSLIRLSELYKVDANFPEIKSILDSNREEKEKLILLDKLLSKIIKDGIKKGLPSLKEKMPGLVEEMDISGVKSASVVAMIQPTITHTPSGVKVTNKNLISGLGEEEFVNHAATTREILKEKSVLVPIGGYISNSIANALADFIYKSSETSTDVQGILVKWKDAIGRYDLNGNKIKTPAKNQEDILVRIKSCIYSTGDYDRHVASDEINIDLYKYPVESNGTIKDEYNIRNNAVIGIESANAATEVIIQSQLALKHGGNLFSPSLECAQAHDDLIVKEINDDRIVLAKGIDRFIYPLPEKFVLSMETRKSLESQSNVLKKDDVIFYIDDTQYVDYNIKRIGSVIGFKLSSQNYNPNATVYESALCISPVEGIIHYDFIKKIVSIGSIKFKLNPKCVYYYPDGTKIKRFQKFCSGTLSPRDIINMTKDRELRFELFYTQMKALMPKLQLLPIELLFKAVFVFGDGTISSGIASDPWQLVRSQNATKSMKAMLAKDVEIRLSADMALGLNMRDQL